MNLLDAIIVLDKDKKITDIKSISPYFKELYENLLSIYINKPILSVFDIDLSQDIGIVDYNNEYFYYKYVNFNDIDFVLIKNVIPKSLIFEKVLDTLHDGVHIYDKNAHLIYFNDASKSISLSNESNHHLGRHLTDIFPNVKEQQSTVLTALRNKIPVINRCETFETSSGNITTTINSGYPIFHNDKLLGSVVIERDLNTLKKTYDELESMKDLISDQISKNSYHKPSTNHNFRSLIGKNKLFVDAVNLAKKVSFQNCNILIYGQTGTGKELFAQSIHHSSTRKNKNFIALNCAAVPETLIEGILFGTEKGAFTGSISRAGLFEEADGGTLFLDELNSMSLSMQSKLLRILQDGIFRRVGGSNNIKSKVRIISSCNQDPFELIENNIIRKDLFYRISTVTIEIPQLKDRIDDIELLVNYFIKEIGNRYVKKIDYISKDVINILKNYNWPGNVRELMHVVEYALNIIDGNSLNIEHLPKYIISSTEKSRIYEASTDSIDESYLNKDLQSLVDEYENKIIRKVLKHNGYNITKASESLGIRRQSLQYRIKKFNIII